MVTGEYISLAKTFLWKCRHADKHLHIQCAALILDGRVIKRAQLTFNSHRNHQNCNIEIFLVLLGWFRSSLFFVNHHL